MDLLGLPWRSTGWGSALPLQGVWVRSLVGELRSHMLRGVAKKKNGIHSSVIIWIIFSLLFPGQFVIIIKKIARLNF